MMHARPDPLNLRLSIISQKRKEKPVKTSSMITSKEFFLIFHQMNENGSISIILLCNIAICLKILIVDSFMYSNFTSLLEKLVHFT